MNAETPKQIYSAGPAEYTYARKIKGLFFKKINILPSVQNHSSFTSHVKLTGCKTNRLSLQWKKKNSHVHNYDQSGDEQEYNCTKINKLCTQLPCTDGVLERKRTIPIAGHCVATCARGLLGYGNVSHSEKVETDCCDPSPLPDTEDRRRC